MLFVFVYLSNCVIFILQTLLVSECGWNKHNTFFFLLRSSSHKLNVRDKVWKEWFTQFLRTTISIHAAGPQLSIQHFLYIHVKYVKSHCVQVCRCINNSPPSICSLHLPISLTFATLHPFSLLHPHIFSSCIDTPPALMKVRILCRSFSLLPVLSQPCEEGVRREAHGYPFIPFS